jgi:gamma-carbonic anhydrase
MSAPVLKEVRGFRPVVGDNVYLAEGVMLIGHVEIGAGSSIWFNTVVRGDVEPIKIGKETNVQDGCVLHGTYGKAALEIGDRVTIGHTVVLHGCKIGSNTLVGMGSVVMDGAQIGENSIVGAGSLVTEGQVFPPRSLIVGRPAKFKRELTQEELNFLPKSADNYLLYKTWYEASESEGK